MSNMIGFDENTGTAGVLTPLQSTASFLMIKAACKENAQALAEIMGRHKIAALAVNAAPSPLLGQLGLSEAKPVRGLSEQERRNLVKAMRDVGDPLAADWFARTNFEIGRMFIFCEGGTLLVNVGPDGNYLEPGSTGSI